MLNRARLFLQKLQYDKSLEWDIILGSELQNEWSCICRQANKTPTVELKRFVGARVDEYSLIAFSDASSSIYGIVVYIFNVTGDVSFLLAKNKLVNSKLSKKSIPSLECQGAIMAAEVLIDLFKELHSDRNDVPINITDLCVYTDSMVSLAWIKSYFISYEKMQKRSTFVLNRLKRLEELSNVKPITFRYVEGKENPADYVSRPTSYNRLKSTNYYDVHRS